MKSIEMQIALPRTQDAGKLQGDQQQRAHAQFQANNEMIHKEDRLKQQTVIKGEQKKGVQNNRDESSSQQQNQQSSKKNPNPKDNKGKVDHPYKGRHIDISS